MFTKEEMNSTTISNATQEEPTPNSPKRLARTAGVLYLLVGIFGGFAQGFVFVEGLDTPELVAAAQASGVRFGTGQAVSKRWFAGDDALPNFPLNLN